MLGPAASAMTSTIADRLGVAAGGWWITAVRTGEDSTLVRQNHEDLAELTGVKTSSYSFIDGVPLLFCEMEVADR